MKISFLFSFISCLKIYCMYVDVYVCQELVGHEDIEQNPKRLSSCGFQKHGVSSYTPSQTHCPCVCVCGGFCSRRPYFITRQPYFVTFSLGGISLRSLNSPWGFRFPKRPFWKLQSTPLFCDTFLRGNKLTFSQFTLGPWGFWYPKRPFWKSKTQTNIGRRQSAPLFWHTFLSGEMSLRSPNSPWSFWFPKRPFWKASTQININIKSWD